MGSSKTTTSRPFGASGRQVPPVAFLDLLLRCVDVIGRRIILPTIFRIVSPSPQKVIQLRKRVRVFGTCEAKRSVGGHFGFSSGSQKPPIRCPALEQRIKSAGETH